MAKLIVPRKFRIGQLVQTKSGKVAKIIGSATYGLYKDSKGRWVKHHAWTEYRLHPSGSRRTIYRRETELRAVTMKRRRH